MADWQSKAAHDAIRNPLLCAILSSRGVNPDRHRAMCAATLPMFVPEILTRGRIGNEGYWKHRLAIAAASFEQNRPQPAIKILSAAIPDPTVGKIAVLSLESPQISDYDSPRRGDRAADCAGLENRCAASVTPVTPSTSALPPERLTGLLTVLDAHPDLQRTAIAWPTLPEHIKAAILTLVGTAFRSSETA